MKLSNLWNRGAVQPPVDRNFFASWKGFCPICLKDTTFTAKTAWFRDNLFCESCEGGSIPRERALMLALRHDVSNWKELYIHESSPAERGVSKYLQRNASRYLPTHYFPDTPPGHLHGETRCENLEAQTFADSTFDVVITQDVMEHVFNPMAAYQEIYRTLKPGGCYIHTTPIYKGLTETVRRASLNADTTINHIFEPEYHGNPISGEGSLVTFHYGYDLADLIAEWTPFDVEIRRFNDRKHGIVAEFTEVIICRK